MMNSPEFYYKGKGVFLQCFPRRNLQIVVFYKNQVVFDIVEKAQPW